VNSKKLWNSEYNKEIERALLARSNGNEGMARVCARRAAGIIIGEYLNRRGYSSLSNSAYERLSIFNGLPDVEKIYKEIANHFLMKVDPDHNLPMKADLISDVIWLEENLLSDRHD
jgi:hypothetical protein